jgi:hypothetical protein
LPRLFDCGITAGKDSAIHSGGECGSAFVLFVDGSHFCGMDIFLLVIMSSRMESNRTTIREVARRRVDFGKAKLEGSR